GVVNVSGGKSVNAQISKGGNQNIYTGGTASGTVVNTSGFQRVSAGASATGTTLSGGNQNIYTGGTASGTLVSSGG
ncbi:AIDA repeat-containing protein, partial [Escherichia coli]|nr:AIDA repeat-containing protein [Escherichia coli]